MIHPPVYISIERETLRRIVHRMAEQASIVRDGVHLAVAPESRAPAAIRDGLRAAHDASSAIVDIVIELQEMVNK